MADQDERSMCGPAGRGTPVDFLPHRGSPPGSYPNLDPTFVERDSRDGGEHYLA